MKRWCFGQSGNEYVLLGVLMLGLALTALLAFGTQLNAVLSELKGEITVTQPNTITVIGNRNNGPAPADTGTKVPTQATSTVKITLSDGTPITLTDFPDDIRQAIQSTGTNGVTQQLAAQLEVLAHKLYEKGKISKEQSDTLLRIAQKSSKFAEVQQVVKEAVKDKVGEPDAFRKTGPVVLDDEIAADAETLADKVGDFEDTGGDSKDVQELKELVEEVKQEPGIAAEPKVKEVITQVVDKIIDVSKTFETKTDSTEPYDPARFEEEVAQEVITKVTESCRVRDERTGQMRDCNTQAASFLGDVADDWKNHEKEKAQPPGQDTTKAKNDDKSPKPEDGDKSAKPGP